MKIISGKRHWIGGITLGLVLTLLPSTDGTAATGLQGATGNCSKPGFVLAPSYRTGFGPSVSAFGDFNGDGKTDLAVANFSSNNVSILLGDGDGTFKAAINFNAGTGPSSIVAADFNGDGKVDLAVANFGTLDNTSTGNVTVLLGNGDGSFQTVVSYNAGVHPKYIVAGDFNGDGKIDLSVANHGTLDNSSTGNVSVLLGNGNGTFQTAVNLPAGDHPNSIALDDFNRDGKADLAVTGEGSNDVSILLGTGNGSFQTAVSYGVGTMPKSVASGDFNGDGTIDLAVGNGNSADVTILLGNGDGSFQSARTVATGLSSNVIAVGDFNQDGIRDLAVGNGQSVAILLGNGNGSFQTPKDYIVGVVESIVVRDFNGDGHSDLVVGNVQFRGVTILFGNGDGTFRAPREFGSNLLGTFLTMGDFNNDGKVDLAVPNSANGQVSVLLGNGDGSFQSPRTFNVVGGLPFAIAEGDFNHDGNLDLAVAIGNGSLGPPDMVSVSLGNGDGTFQAPNNYNLPTTAIIFSVIVGDFNGDGKLDLAVPIDGGGTSDLAILPGNGDGTFGNAQVLQTGIGTGFGAEGDFNHDGVADLALIGSTSDEVLIMLGKRDGTFQSGQRFSVGTDPSSVVVADFNGDHNPDVAVTNGGSGSVSILLGNGDGTFRPAREYQVESGPLTVLVGDFNGDSIPDLMVTSFSSSLLTMLLGNGDGTFQPKISLSTGFSVGQRASAQDLNADGRADLIFASGAVLLNTCSVESTTSDLSLLPGGSNSVFTAGTAGTVRAGYVLMNFDRQGSLYATAVFSLMQDGVIVSEAGVPVSPPTTAARIFIDFRNGVTGKSSVLEAAGVNINTGLAIVNVGETTAHVNFTLRGKDGVILATGSGTVPIDVHLAKFVDQLHDVAPDFQLPPNFASTTQFGSLEIRSDQLLSIVALRLTTNQRGETLITTTPIVDLSLTTAGTQLFFPHLVDGGGYKTTVVLLNASGQDEAGTLQAFADDGTPLAVRQANGSSGSSFAYSIQPGGIFVFQTDGSPTAVNAGWIRVTADPGSPLPVGAGIFGFTQGGVLVTESGIPSALPTTHARIYIDESRGHDTGLAIAAPGGGSVPLTLMATQVDGQTPAGNSSASLNLNANGHAAKFVGQLISGLSAGFTGVLDLSAPSDFVVLTLRSLNNSRGDFLLTTFPVADVTRPAPSPLIFPQIADGGGYQTQFILLNAGSQGTVATLRFYGDDGSPLPVGKMAH